MEKKFYSIGVHDLLDTVLRSGSLDNSFFSGSRAVEGTSLHKKIQLGWASGYKAEVPLSHIFSYPEENINLELKGIADGIFESPEGVTIDEIKVIFSDIRRIEKNSFPNHWNQAKCYAFMYAFNNKLEQVCVQLTYFFPEKNKTKIFKEIFGIGELELFVFGLINKYHDKLSIIHKWKEERDSSIKELIFPYINYNRGQREFAVSVFKTIKERKKLFAQAPTGIGKTLASIFPAVKAIGEGFGEKIFYLTSKTSTQAIAEITFELLRENGLKFKVTSLTAKEKICFKDTALCEPYYCEYANGHFDRVDSAIESLIGSEKLSKSEISETAQKFMVCPFELSLDLALFSDGIICDYNYAFDPRVFLKRFFLKKGEYIFLVDEAHNLVDRSREMFSSEIYSTDILPPKKAFKEINQDIYLSLSKINSFLSKHKKDLAEQEKTQEVLDELPEKLISNMEKFLKSAEKWLERNSKSQFNKLLIDLYFKINAFVKTSENFDEKFVVYYEKAVATRNTRFTDEDFKVKIFCLDPSSLLSNFLDKGLATVFFSATLLPIEYFVRLFGGKEDSERKILPSPFPKENLCLLVESSISTKYKDRESTYLKVVQIIEKLVLSKKGNFLIFFPSHQYLQQVYKLFEEKVRGVDTLVQTNRMGEEERADYIERFSQQSERSLAAFAVMGGIFGEGIDLRGEKLSGALIIGVGFPQICLEREIIKDYFKKNTGTGFEYSYIFPGMIKVMQAAGRVIRSVEDRGVVILVDERFEHKIYKRLFPQEWSHAKKISEISIDSALKDFWEKGE